jgi:formyltetrahydrofolate-dependent phosphoribosylglycinamide formyltransferase
MSQHLFSKLQTKWKVSTTQFWLIILTFALGGSLSGRLCSAFLNFLFLEKNWVFWLFYPIILTILWPFSVIFVSFFTGQFSFFKGYLSRLFGKLLGNTPLNPPNTSMKHIAIFASGAGSNARKIIEYFENPSNKGYGQIKVSLIVCNVPTAGVLDIAKEKGIPTLLIDRKTFKETGYVSSLQNAGIDFVVLAGFLWMIPGALVKAYHNKMINIHPALLPKYGGKGMYGSNVHQAVIDAKEVVSGITIHWVNEHYDEGGIIFQASCTVTPEDSPESLASKIHALEHAHFAPTIANIILD